MNTSELFPTPPQREEQLRKYSRPKTTVHLPSSPAPQPMPREIVDLGAEGDFERHGDDLNSMQWELDEGVLEAELKTIHGADDSHGRAVILSDKSGILGNDHGKVIAIPTPADEHASHEVVGKIVRDTLEWIRKSQGAGMGTATNNTLPDARPVDEN